MPIASYPVSVPISGCFPAREIFAGDLLRRSCQENEQNIFMWFQIDKRGFNDLSAMYVMKAPFLAAAGFELLAAFYTLLMPGFLAGSLPSFKRFSIVDRSLRNSMRNVLEVQSSDSAKRAEW